MALKKILTEPNKVLRQKSLPVEKVDGELQILMDDMLETMYAAPGIGLAAIQIGIPKRVIVLDIAPKDEPKNPMYFINPEIIEKAESNSTYEEGCLSVPGQFAEIDRPSKCHVKYLDYSSLSSELTVPQSLEDLASRNEIGLVMLKIIEIIGEDDIHNLDPETIYFLNVILNKLDLKKIRNNILSEALPVKV